MKGNLPIGRDKKEYEERSLVCPVCGGQEFNFVCSSREIPRDSIIFPVHPTVYTCCACSAQFNFERLNGFFPTWEEVKDLRRKNSERPAHPTEGVW